MYINETLIRLMLAEMEVLRIQLMLIEKELEVLPMLTERAPSRVEADLDAIIHQWNIARTNDDRHLYCF